MANPEQLPQKREILKRHQNAAAARLILELTVQLSRTSESKGHKLASYGDPAGFVTELQQGAQAEAELAGIPQAELDQADVAEVIDILTKLDRGSQTTAA